jgi:hypothetical protein
MTTAKRFKRLASGRPERCATRPGTRLPTKLTVITHAAGTPSRHALVTLSASTAGLAGPIWRRQSRMTVNPQQIKVRKVTHWQPTFNSRESGHPGVYTFQLILDNGADEHILSVTAEDADNLFDWLHASSDVYYDLERKVLMFGTRAVGD